MNTKQIIKAIVLVSAFASASSNASVAHLVLNGTYGDWITGGVPVDNIYSSTDPLLIWNWVSFNNIGTNSHPVTDGVSFTFLRAPWLVADDEYATLNFSTRQLGTELLTGLAYEGAERAPFASPGHPGLEVNYDHRGCNTLSGSFTVNQLSFIGDNLGQFSASFSQSCDGGAVMNGTFSYDASLTSLPSHVPEPATLALVSFGIIGMSIVRSRKMAAR